MTQTGRRGRRWLGVLALAVLAGGGLAWLQRGPLLAWLYVGRLAAAADDAARERWARRVGGLGAAALPRLLAVLSSEAPAACANARAGLAAVAAPWPRGDDRAVALTHRLADGYGGFSVPGRRCALEAAAGWLGGDGDLPAPLAQAGARLLALAADAADADEQAAGLALCAAIGGKGGDEVVKASRLAVRRGLRAATPALRVRAVRLALLPGVGLLEEVAGLLQDPDAEVRRAAVLAVGPAVNVVLDETLLPCLNDPDPQVRALAEAALTAEGRDLKPEHVWLGRLLTAPDPLQRLRVLDELAGARDLDPGVWLRRLSHDPSASVRIAAARYVAERSVPGLADRLDQMASADPSEAVRRVAAYCVRQARDSRQDEP
jgi:hypothetical protein